MSDIQPTGIQESAKGIIFSGNTAIGFDPLLEEMQDYFASTYSHLLAGGAGAKEELKKLIEQYIMKGAYTVEGLDTAGLVSRLYQELAEYSFLTDFLNDSDVEEIDINRWDDIEVRYSDGKKTKLGAHFRDDRHCEDLIKRLLHHSGMIIDSSAPLVRGHLSNKIRITAIGNPITDAGSGVAASIRVVNPKKFAREDFVANGTARSEMLDFLTFAFSHGVSMCITGATDSGKTTLMSYILSTVPDGDRIVTIENEVREFDLIKRDVNGNVINNVVHLVTRNSENKDLQIDQERLLEQSLTMNPDVICVGEAKSAEAYTAQEAARTGHSVIITVHTNSGAATYSRLVSLCQQKYHLDEKVLFRFVTEAFPVVVYMKKFREDGKRRVVEISECKIVKGKRVMSTLYRWKRGDDGGKDGFSGAFVKANDISEALQRRLKENGGGTSDIGRFLKKKKAGEGGEKT
jgi:pilus assembly protein CpaF